MNQGYKQQCYYVMYTSTSCTTITTLPLDTLREGGEEGGGSGISLDGFLGFLPPIAGRLGFSPDMQGK